MNTPGHVVVSSLVLRVDRHPRRTVPAVLGAVLPGAPMFYLYVDELDGSWNRPSPTIDSCPLLDIRVRDLVVIRFETCSIGSNEPNAKPSNHEALAGAVLGKGSFANGSMPFFPLVNGFGPIAFE